MTERLRILLLEDVADDAELALLELRRAGLHADQRVVESEKSFVGALREFAPDVILSDFSMPGFDRSEERRVGKECSCRWSSWRYEKRIVSYLRIQLEYYQVVTSQL